MKRIAILDHFTSILYVEDVDETILSKYSNIPDYIEDNYNLLGDYSWEYVKDAQYFPECESDPIEINFEDIKDI